MAKEKEGKIFDIKDVNKLLKDLNPLGGFMKDSDFSEITEWIDTGNYSLNALISGDIYKGIPNNRITLFAGDSGVGKTSVCLNITRNLIKQGYTVLYYDTENSVDKDFMLNFGIDLDKVIYQPLNIIEDFRHNIVSLLSKLIEVRRSGGTYPKLAIFLDSLGKIQTKKSLNDAIDGSDKQDMTRAKLIKNTLDLITIMLAELKIPMVINGHTYQSQDFIPKEILAGGKSGYFTASTIIFFRKSQLKDGNEKIGIKVTATSVKNRLAQPEKQIEFHIIWNKPFNRYVGLDDYLTYDICKTGRGDFDKDGKFIEKQGQKIVSDFFEGSRPYNNRFNENVFNKDVLDLINNHIKEEFKYVTFKDGLENLSASQMGFDSIDKNNENEVDILISDNFL